MFFGDLRDSLLETLRSRVRNGELTERSLARLVGISQPHIHNVLKGVRNLSPDMMDRFLYHLRISALDLVDRSELARYLGSESSETSRYSYLPVVAGRLGPGHPWPVAVEAHERFPVAATTAHRMWHPVIARVAGDVRMHPLFADGDLLLLDQSHRARTEFDKDSLYVIKRGRVGLVRRIRVLSQAVYLASEDCIDRPGLWERLPVEGHHVAHFVRARAILLAREMEWNHERED
jgi:hypothetical protein